MAICNSTEIDTLLKVFPELSVAEAKSFMLYSSGTPAKVIANELNVSVKTINTHINNAQQKYELSSYFELRTMCMTHSFLVALDGVIQPSDFLTELSHSEIEVYTLFALGRSAKAVSIELGICEDSVYEQMEGIKSKLQIQSTELLRSNFLYKMTIYALDHCVASA